ncbi:MAG TPA: RNA 2',3'-cyclic phosphodiesterase [Labilithrix sp.]|nr:RNA 2',3'-cyclic phosphodiesterase [Labilithrix sp.]
MPGTPQGCAIDDGAGYASKVLRTFLALDLDEPFVQDALALADELCASCPSSALAQRGRWVKRSMMHVTLRFLGHVDEELVLPLSEVVTELGKVQKRAIELESTSLVAFPNAKRAHVLALHLEDPGALAELSTAAERALATLGFIPEVRAFRPHLTLARFRAPADLRRLFAEHQGAMRGGRLNALTLYKSELGREAPRYSVLARAPLDNSDTEA